ncbi:extracellular solute-binding protein [Micromonospora sp. LZ34]
MDRSPLSRRSLLRMIGAGAAAVAVPGLAACGGSGGNSGSVGNAGKDLVPWPTYVPFTGVKPDLPGDDRGVQGAYLTYPQTLAQSVAAKPGDGSTVHALIITYSPPPRPAGENEFWKLINQTLGIDLKLTHVPSADYPKKMATLMASGDMPDLMVINGEPPNIDQFIAAKCADLSESLSGDAIKKFPNLANIPPYAWQGAGRVGGRLMTVPIERPRFNYSLHVNRSLLDSTGVPKNWTQAEFEQAMTEVTKGRRWGMGSDNSELGLTWHAMSFGAPNAWEVKDGKFIGTWESERWLPALEFTAKLRKAGLYHPDAQTMSAVDMKAQFYNQSVASMPDGLLAYVTTVGKIKGAWTVDLGRLYRTDAPGGVHFAKGIFGRVVIKKAAKERVELILRLLDYLAAPFGTKEYEVSHFGVEGKHFTRNADGSPKLTPLADMENPNTLGIRYVMDAPNALYIPGDPEAAKRMHAYQSEMIDKALPNPAAGLTSDSASTLEHTLRMKLRDKMAAITAGREPVSAWTAAVKEWKAQGGDKIAEEYAKEYAAAQKG